MSFSICTAVSVFAIFLLFVFSSALDDKIMKYLFLATETESDRIFFTNFNKKFPQETRTFPSVGDIIIDILQNKTIFRADNFFVHENVQLLKGTH